MNDMSSLLVRLTGFKSAFLLLAVLNVCVVPFLSAWLLVTIVARLQATILEGVHGTQRKPSVQYVRNKYLDSGECS